MRKKKAQSPTSPVTQTPHDSSYSNWPRVARFGFMPLTRSLIVLVSLLAIPIRALPMGSFSPLLSHGFLEELDDGATESTSILWNFMVIAGLVLTGGVFAGLTLGLMGLDETTLRVLVQSGENNEKIHADKVLKLLEHGKHWVLVTLLLGNVIVNETLPIILDNVFGGGWQAVLISTGLIVLFGEIIPQAICVRHGLSIGAFLSPFVLFLMYALYPVAYPIALLLDYFLGEHHGTVYRRTELKTLVSLHQTTSSADVEGLSEDEVTIIGAVLELRQKPVSFVMTPMEDVYTLGSNHILDKSTIEQIRLAGYSRIPIHAPENQTDFVGMLLVKQLIVYDPEDAVPVSTFSLSPLPRIRPDTSCLDILNFFQEGRSHMALIISKRNEDYDKALGVITLEDVIEELIGEEIVDETDVFVDVHNKMRVTRVQKRRMTDMSVHAPTNSRSSAAPKGVANNVNVKGYGAVVGDERENERESESTPLVKKD